MKVTDTRACHMTDEEVKADKIARRPEPGSSMEEKLIAELKYTCELGATWEKRAKNFEEQLEKWKGKYEKQVELRYRRRFKKALQEKATDYDQYETL